MRDFRDKWSGLVVPKDDIRALFKKKMEKEILMEDKNHLLLDRKATVAEIVLALTILLILTCSLLTYSKLYRQEQMDKKLIEQVNAQVSQYFQLAGDEPESDRVRRVSAGATGAPAAAWAPSALNTNPT